MSEADIKIQETCVKQNRQDTDQKEEDKYGRHISQMPQRRMEITYQKGRRFRGRPWKR